jgi:hypothetical protein
MRQPVWYSFGGREKNEAMGWVWKVVHIYEIMADCTSGVKAVLLCLRWE